GTLIDPRAVQDHAESYDLQAITDEKGISYTAALEIVEWTMAAERRLYLCDGAGFPLDELSPGVQAPGFNFTAYLRSDYFARLANENRIELAGLDPIALRALATAKDRVRDHFRRRASEKAKGLVEEWQREKVY